MGMRTCCPLFTCMQVSSVKAAKFLRLKVVGLLFYIMLNFVCSMLNFIVECSSLKVEMLVE